MNHSVIKVAVLLLSLTVGQSLLASDPPRLVLQITVDQLRGDLPTRYRDRMGEGGFVYLFEEGTYFANAHYQHANTETIVGHTSLATGAVPAVHGMIGNVWFDNALGRLVYNIEDADYPLLTVGADVDDNSEIDPTQRVANADGRSPNAIMVSTFSDELAARYGGKSKVFAVSVKDRGAVSLAGHAGKAFWFSKAAGEFVSSRYYFEKYPEWVNQWNALEVPQQFADTSWTLLHPQDSYLFGDKDDREWETDFPGFGRTFPHAFGAGNDPYFITRLTLSPAGDRITLDFAKTLLAAEDLGQDNIPDFLGVSFSSTDYVGHIFGASSLEAEDNILRFDRTLAELLDYVDQEVGLEHTLVVLAADHGGPDTPGYLQELGHKNAGYFDTDALDGKPAIERLKKKFGINDTLISLYSHPYVYLDGDVIDQAGLDLASVQQAVADELVKFKGIHQAIPSTAISTNSMPDLPLSRMVKNNFNAKRSGDIYVVFDPNVFINDMDGLVVASTHGSPWGYDTFVPVFFAGNGVKSGTVYRSITPYDIAPTLAAALGTKPPSGAVGDPLPEVLDR